MGGGLEFDLSRYAVPVLWSERPATAEGSRHVLQVADVMRHRHVPNPDGTGLVRPAPPRYQQYRLLLSDGVYAQHAMLAPALHHLDLRRGSVVLLLRFVRVHNTDPDHLRSIVIFELKILQTECALIGSLKLYKPPVFSTRRYTVSCGFRSDCKSSFGVQHIRYGPSCGCYPSGGDRLSSVALSEKTPVWKMVGQIKDENLGYSDKPDLITVKATIASVSVNPRSLYDACPLVVNGKRWNAEATGDMDWTLRHDRCGCRFLDPAKYGCSVCIQIQDHTGTVSATAYEEATEEIFGCRARDLYWMKYEEHDYEQLDDIIHRAVGEQYVFQLNVRLLSSGVVKCLVVKAEKVNPSAESHRLLGQINTLLQEGSGSGLELHSPTMPTCTGSLDSRVCSSVWQSSNSINSDWANSPIMRALMIQQQLRGCAV